MSVFTPTKMPVPSWMKMNDVLIAYETRMDDAENAIEEYTQEQKDESLVRNCSFTSTSWRGRDYTRKRPNECNDTAMQKPELKLRHTACKKLSGPSYKLVTKMTYGTFAPCDMYDSPGGTIFPEYAYCLKPGGMQYTDCQLACYAFPDQPGCEAIKSMNLSEFQRRKIISSLKSGKPITPPAPATKVNVEATLKSVKPGAIEISYTDPNTNKPTVVTKTLVDMYKPNDSVSVIIAKPAGTFLGFNRK